MSSMQNLITWIRSKSRKAKNRSTSSLYDTNACEIDLDFNNDQLISQARSRQSVCRSSMKLPPIPRGERDRQSNAALSNRRLCVPMMGVASLRTDSPAHIYEEILINDSDSEYSKNSDSDSGGSNKSDASSTEKYQTEQVNVANLDFNHAKDFGSFLVVPIRSRLQNQSEGFTCAEENNNKDPDLAISSTTTTATTTIPTTSPCDRRVPPHYHHREDSCLDNISSCTYPGDVGSSGDSAIGDMSVSHDHSSDNFPHVHCGRCRRPHGIFNGITLSHIDEKVDLESLEIQTYFNKQMIEVRDGDEPVERFLIVPSVSDMSAHNHLTQPHHTGQSLETTDIVNDNNELLPTGQPVNEQLKHSSNTQGSDDSNDTCNEYDMRSSDLSSSSHTSSRPGSYAFDSGSSLYAFSNTSSDKDAPGVSAKTVPTLVQSSRHKHQESDSSNDTFSEYDTHTPSGGEYEYYLSKAEHNMWLKRDVMRVIRESDTSEYETTDSQSCSCDCTPNKNSDNSSLTTITSLSDLSLSDKDNHESVQQHQLHKARAEAILAMKEKCKSERKSGRACSCHGHPPKKTSRHKTKVRTKHRPHNSEHGSVKTNQPHNSEESSVSESVHVSKSRHQKQTKAKDNDSASSQQMLVGIPAWEREAGVQSAFTEYKKPGSRKPRSTSSHKKRAELYCLPDFSDSSASTSSSAGRDADVLEKLSCRATDFMPPTAGPQVHSSSSSSSSSRRKSSSRGVTSEVNRHLVPELRRRPTQPQNRILSDLMKMNHDRLLVQF